MSPEQFICYMAVNTLVAVGTLGTVAVALWGNYFKTKWWPPQFEAKIFRHEGEKTTFTRRDTGALVDHTRFYHLQVSNKRTWSKATSVGVHLVRIEEPGLDDRLQITWIGDLQIRCRHQEFYPLKQEMGSEIDYDLCSITRTNPILTLWPIIPANNLSRERRGPLRVVASFQVRSSEGNSDLIRVQMYWDGQWEDGDTEMQRHFKPIILARTEGATT
jgi:hypothetical protein